MAGEDVGAGVALEDGVGVDAAAEVFHVVFHIGSDVAAEDNLAVVEHPQVVDGDGEMIEIGIETGAGCGVSGLEQGEEVFEIAIRQGVEQSGVADGVEAADLPAVAARSVEGIDQKMAHFSGALVIAGINFIVDDHGAADAVVQA